MSYFVRGRNAHSYAPDVLRRIEIILYILFYFEVIFFTHTESILSYTVISKIYFIYFTITRLCYMCQSVNFNKYTLISQYIHLCMVNIYINYSRLQEMYTFTELIL